MLLYQLTKKKKKERKIHVTFSKTFKNNYRKKDNKK